MRPPAHIAAPDSAGPRPADWRNLRRAAAAFRPYRAQLVLVFCCVLASTLLSVANPLLARAIFDDAIPRRSFRHLVLYSILMFASPVLNSLIGLAQSMLNTKVAQSVIRDFRIRLYNHLQRMPLGFFTGTRGGEIQARFTSDIGGLQNFLTNTAINAVANASSVMTVVITMFCISPMLMFLSLALLPPVLINNQWIAKRRRALSADRQNIMANLSSLMHETLSVGGVMLTRTFGRQKEASRQFSRQTEGLAAVEIKQQLLGRIGFMGLGALFAAVPATIFFLAGWQLIRNVPFMGVSMTAGTLVAFVAMQSRLFGQASMLLGQPASMQASLVLVDRVFEYLDLPVEIADRPGAIGLAAGELRGEVSFRDVWFSYRRPHGGPTGSDRPTLRSISFDIVPGEMVALVGSSGAGKTTVSSLLPRLYDVDAGAVLIDGHDIRDIALESLAAAVGIVPQETFLLHASVRENLLYANPLATEEELFEAARAAAIHDRIMALENRYDTVVGERGFKLSGGEKQRLAIARILLKNPRILVLDEATSALDSHSERLVQNALEALMKGRTTLVIAHRLSTVVAANTILVMDGGEIIDRGTHAELTARGGLYARLVDEQFGRLRPERHDPAAAAGRWARPAAPSS